MIFALHPWYATMRKPLFALPVGVILPVHMAAIVFAGFGAQVVMGNVSGNPAVRPARQLYGMWLVAHGIWLIIFAGLHFPVLGLGTNIIQWGIAVLCIQKFFNVDPKAGQKVLPFFLITTYWMLVNGFILSY